MVAFWVCLLVAITFGAVGLGWLCNLPDDPGFGLGLMHRVAAVVGACACLVTSIAFSVSSYALWLMVHR